jgi:ectoine hydroxylase-related dioxygenase (phytanoyl-CoA dioxygenase family)
MTDIRQQLTTGKGYIIFEHFVPSYLIADIKSILPDLHPVRASSSKKVYAERDAIKDLEDISVWWSQSVENYKPVQKVKTLIDNVVENNFAKLKFYASDMVTIKSGSTWVNPHVDTPHRFEKWNYVNDLLGIQCIINLDPIDAQSASTGLVPFSQKRDWNINDCYTGKFDRWFLDNVQQHSLPKGSLLMYNCRVLHSSMPNPQTIDRPALLLNYLDSTIINEVAAIDNVWSSNGKSS